MSETIEKIIIGSDHAGYALKEFIKSELDRLGIHHKDIGTNSTDSVDYPIYAARVAKGVVSGDYTRGIAICGSGLGASMVANRFKGIRAALCVTEEMARYSRQHNNANVLVLGERITPVDIASKILRVWLEEEFDGGRHERRLKLIDEIPEKEYL